MDSNMIPYLYLVAGYDSLKNGPARVYVYGFYDTLEQAEERQKYVSGGYMYPIYENSRCMHGKNGLISWIKTAPMGDANLFDIRQPL